MNLIKAKKNLDKSENHLIVIGGPTAIGKTEIALKLAIQYDCPILSADSRQFYREMNIGTAKPTEDELNLAKHYFINNLSIKDNYSVGDFERESIQKLSEIFQKSNVAILTGGTGLYIKAILEGLDQFPDIDPSVRRELNKKFRTEGIASLQESLKEKDPEYYQKVDLDNPHRLIRALSVIHSSGRPFSSFLNESKSERSFTPIKIALTLERHILYEKINKRVDSMMQQGLMKEVKGLYKNRDLNALNTVGYSELFEHLDGKCFESEAVEQIKQNTRRYAKRQTTWFRNQGEWNYFDVRHPQKIIDFLSEQISI